MFLVYLLLLVHIPRDLVQSVLYVLELLADLVNRVRASNGVSVSGGDLNEESQLLGLLVLSLPANADL